MTDLRKPPFVQIHLSTCVAMSLTIAAACCLDYIPRERILIREQGSYPLCMHLSATGWPHIARVVEPTNYDEHVEAIFDAFAIYDRGHIRIYSERDFVRGFFYNKVIGFIALFVVLGVCEFRIARRKVR